MTAVATQSNIHSVPRSWNGGGQHGIDTMTADVYIPRSKGPRYTLSSAASSTSSLESGSSNGSMNGWPSSLSGKKKSISRTSSVGSAPMTNGNIWPKSDKNHAKQSVGKTVPNGTNHATSPLDESGPVSTSQHLINTQLQDASVQHSYLFLSPLNSTFDRKIISLPFFPESLRIGRQTNAKTIPTPSNGYFDSKVLSRVHAEIWAEKGSGKVWIRDIKSSNGTFVNGQRLSQENQDSEPHELRQDDILELGIDIVGEDNRTIVHHKVAARVEHAGATASSFDLNFGDMESLVGGGLVPPPVDRVGSQGSLRGRGAQSTRGQISTGAAHRLAPVSVPPVTLEMVVKKLNGELLSAYQQSSDLQRTTELVDFVHAALPVKQHVEKVKKSKPQLWNKKKPNGVHAEESPFGPLLWDQKPPVNGVHDAEPALEPLLWDQKPPVNGVHDAEPALEPLLWDQKPHLNGVHEPKPPFVIPQPVATTELTLEEIPELASSARSAKSERSGKSLERPNPPQQLLLDALAKTRKEMEEKTALVKDLEEALKKERRAREDAEDRAAILENATKAIRAKPYETPLKELLNKKNLDGSSEGLDGVNGKREGSITLQDESSKIEQIARAAANAAENHQKRMEEMIEELRLAKEKMDSFRTRAEIAEKDRDSDRATLAQMIQTIRDREDQRRAQRREQGCQTEDNSTVNNGVQVAIEEARVKSTHNIINDVDLSLSATSRSLTKESTLLIPRNDNTAYASILGVVIFGVGLMTVINGWQKAER